MHKQLIISKSNPRDQIVSARRQHIHFYVFQLTFLSVIENVELDIIGGDKLNKNILNNVAIKCNIKFIDCSIA